MAEQSGDAADTKPVTPLASSAATAAPRNAERLKFFTDAVVAIAMTLLILPLLESISDAAAEGKNAGQWLSEHDGQVFAFVLSFAIIFTFWSGHHNLFAHVRYLAPRMTLLNLVWMIAIVWLPVATAMVGSMGDDDTTHENLFDRTQVVLYIGAMLLASLVTVLINLVLQRHPECWEPDDPLTKHGVSVSLAMSLLFALAMVVTLVWMTLGYFSMFLLLLTGPLESVIYRALTRGDRRDPADQAAASAG